MKRHALLIGYSGGGSSGESYLSGVSLDLENYQNFLMSTKGGAWHKNEITILQNTSKRKLVQTLDQIKNELNDITLVIFSGHGDFENKVYYCRDFLINSSGETILEKDLYGLSSKEILICDCCANYQYRRAVVANEAKDINLDEAFDKKKCAREKYEKIINECPKQKLRFYAARAGYSAQDTEDGGLYSVNLLKVLKEAHQNINIVDAHDKAAEMVIQESSGEQCPSKRVDRVINYLPGAISI